MPSRSANEQTPQAGATDLPPTGGRRNHILGVLSGGLAGMGGAFLDGDLIIVGLLTALTNSPFLIALVPIVRKVAIFGPHQLWLGSLLEHRPRRMRYFIALIPIAAAGFVGIVLGMWLLGRSVGALSLTLFFVALFVANACNGIASVLQMDMVGRMIPAGRLGSFFGMRRVLATLLAAVAGLAIIQRVLERVDLPMSYMLLAAMGGAILIASMALFTCCREQDGPMAKRETTFVESLRRGFGWLRHDRNYRAYFLFFVGFRISLLSMAFYIPYGSEKLTVAGPGGLALLGGFLIAARQVSEVVSSAIWGRLADRRGFRACLIACGTLYAMASLLVLLAPRLPGLFSVALPGTNVPLDLPLTVFLLTMPMLGAALQARIIGHSHFVVSSAPPERRPSYIGFINTVTSPLIFLSLLGAALARSYGYSAAYWMAAGGGVLSLLSAAAMKKPAVANDATDS